MYNYEIYIKDYLFQNQSLSLEGIGDFLFVKPSDPSSVEFHRNRKATTTPAFIEYVAQSEQKNKFLVASDVESFLSQVKQFINIGRPFIISGIGTVQLGKNWEYEFVSDTHNNTERREVEPVKKRKPVTFTEPVVTPEEKRTTPAEKRKGSLNGTVLIVTLVIVVGIGYTVYHFMSNAPEVKNFTEDTLTAIPAAPVQTIAPDTQTASATTAPVTKGYNYVFETTNNAARAYRRYNQLVTLNVPQLHMDSTVAGTEKTYKLYVSKTTMPSDTARVKDSLSAFFGRRVLIEPINK